jgi:DNA-binding beta-propeller fold protein YncE
MHRAHRRMLLTGALIAAALVPSHAAADDPAPPLTAAAPTSSPDADPAPAVTFTRMHPTPIGLHDDGPWDVEVFRGGTRAVVVSDNKMLKLDITRRPSRVIGTATNIFGDRMAVHPNGKVAYVVDNDKLYVVDINARRPRLIRTMHRVADQMKSIDIAPGGAAIFIVHGVVSDSTVRVLSLANAGLPRVIGSARIEGHPTDVAVNPAANRLITTHGDFEQKVSFIDVSTRSRPRVLSTVNLPFEPGRVAIGPGGGSAFVLGDPFRGEPRIAKFDVPTRQLRKIRPVAAGSFGGGGIDVSPTGTYVYAVINQAIPNAASVVIVRARGLGRVVAFTGPDHPMALTVSLAGPTRGRIYFTSQSDVDGTPAVFYPIRPS